MDPYLLLVIPVAVVATATLSGVLGMAGGLVLMAFYAWVLPTVPQAMVLHGVTQLASNGFRAYLLRRHVHLGILGWYVVGAVASIAVFSALSLQPDRPTLFVVLGAIPILGACVPRRWSPPVERPAVAALCGAVVNAAQLVAGVSGALLDVFFLGGRLDRRTVVATKAVTQTLGHLAKIFVYGAAAQWGRTDALPWWIFPVVVVAAMVGTRCGTALLKHVDERAFRSWSGRVVVVLGVILVVRGILAAQ